MTKSVKVYDFESTTGAARDISELDRPRRGGEEGWGGLIESSDRRQGGGKGGRKRRETRR